MAKVQLHEVRQLMLPLDTAVDAVIELDCEQGGSLAFGMILKAQIESDPEPGLLVVVQRRGTESAETRKFELPLLAAAFIRYCWKCRIPLPRAGVKKIEISPEGFVFTIEGTVEVVRRHGAVPRREPPRAVVVPVSGTPMPETEPPSEAGPVSETEPQRVSEPLPEPDMGGADMPTPEMAVPMPEQAPERVASAN